MDPDAYRAYTEELRARVDADPRVVGLVAVGSMADRDYGPDEWSDHDFFVITPPGGQEELRQDLSWLPRADEILFSFRETAHGLKVFYADGHMLEFAVFDVEEIALAGVNRWRTLLDRDVVEEKVAQVAASPRAQPDDEHLFGMVLSGSLVAAGRARRGEVLSGAYLVPWAITYLTRLVARSLPSDDASLLDGFDSLRRFERAYPELGAELAAVARLPAADAGPALLDLTARTLRERRPDLPWAALDAVRARL